MTIFGKPLSDYFSFCKLFLGLILIVGITRLALSLSGVPNSAARWFSITVVAWISVVYYGVRVYTSGFGSYRQLLPIYYLLSWTAQLVVVPSILLAILTGKDNIYSAPEFAFGRDGKTWVHLGSHLLIPTTVLPLIFWLVGCVIMFVTKKLATGDSTKAAARA
jgi:hypothetical protein